MHVTVAKIYEPLFAGEAFSLSARTTEGEVTILPHHEPFVANLGIGNVIVRTDQGEQTFAIDGGILEVSYNNVTVLL